ncbi:MAG: hypothetical protein ACK6CU_24375 [Deltaproteobacteria bacterium]
MSTLATARRRALAIVVTSLAASVAYVAACVYDRLVTGLADPYLIVRDVHFGYYHRAGLALWLGGVAGLVAYRTLERRERVELLVRFATPLVLPLVLLVALAAYVFP